MVFCLQKKKQDSINVPTPTPPAAQMEFHPQCTLCCRPETSHNANYNKHILALPSDLLGE